MQGLTLALALTGASALVAPAAPRAATALKAEAAEVSNTDEVFDYSSIAGGESGLGAGAGVVSCPPGVCAYTRAPNRRRRRAGAA